MNNDFITQSHALITEYKDRLSLNQHPQGVAKVYTLIEQVKDCETLSGEAIKALAACYNLLGHYWPAYQIMCVLSTPNVNDESLKNEYLNQSILYTQRHVLKNPLAIDPNSSHH